MRQFLQRSPRVRRLACSRRGHHFVTLLDQEDRPVCCVCGEVRDRRPQRQYAADVDLVGDLRARYEAETGPDAASDDERAA